MPKIQFTQSQRKSFEVNSGVNLMQALLEKNIPVASSCHGDGVCGKCVLKITKGEESLARPNETENFLIQKLKLKPPQRISCQVTVVKEDLTVEASYW